MRYLSKKEVKMNQVMTDIWPYLVAPIMAAVGWLFREVYVLKTEVSVVKKSIELLQATIKSTDENIQKTIEKIQERLDSHSRKQDDMLNRFSSMEKEVLRETGAVKADISSLASDVKGLSNLILASDSGLKIPRIS